MKTPTHLKHKPIIKVDDYHKFELNPDTDAKALSIGFAQWSYDEPELKNKYISAKVFRYIDGRWSPQSEELPPHRVIDLCILTLASFIMEDESNAPTKLGETISNKENLVYIKKYFKENEKKLIPKIEELQRVVIDVFNKKIK